jgi:hypothetical protein
LKSKNASTKTLKLASRTTKIDALIFGAKNVEVKFLKVGIKMKKYIKIKKAELVPDKFGQHIKIGMIGLYEPDGTWVRWVKLNQALLDKLVANTIEVDL